jgi:exonuclease SbcC
VKIIHFSDLHYSKDNEVAAGKSLDSIEREADKGVDLFAFTGDLYDHGIPNSEEGGLPWLQDRIRRLRERAPILFASGTITHDVPGCYDALVRAWAPFPMIEIGPTDSIQIAGALVMGCPEPSKRWILAGKSMSKDEAVKAVKDAMRALFLGWAVQRAEHPDLPCIFLFHGQVAGATLDNNTVLRPGGIQIGAEDLRSIGADYIALGDIHLGQQIGDLPAYYAGSAFPQSWGETDLKCFNEVEISGGPEMRARKEGESLPIGDHWVTRIIRVPYGHPQRKVIDIETVPTLDLAFPVDCRGFQTKMRITNTDGRRGIDKDRFLAWMLEVGALPGSEVEIIEQHVETLRAAGIKEARTLWDKIVVWAANGNQPLPPQSIMAKAGALEAEAEKTGSVSRLRYRLRWLKVRGSIGVWKGQRKDEAEIDFDELEPGLIALVGESGSSKTTLAENCTPFPNMLTRSGTLQAHFRLRDSRRELCFEDDASGIVYRVLMLIDGKNKTGSVEYFLFHHPPNSAESPLTNGRKDDYEEKIARLFGSQELFVRGAFCPQNTSRTPDLSQATKGEKKAIFRELGGLDYLQSHAETAIAKRKELEVSLVPARSEIDGLLQLVASLPALEQQKQTAQGRIVNAKDETEKISPLESGAKTKMETLAETLRSNKTLSDQVDVLHRKYNTLREADEKDNFRLKWLENTLSAEPAARAAVARFEELQAQEAVHVQKESEILKERERISTENRKRAEAYADGDRKSAAARQTIKDARSALVLEALGVKKDRDALEKIIAHPIIDTCPKCKQKLPPAELEAMLAERKEEKKEYVRLDGLLGEYDTKITAKEAELTFLPLDVAPRQGDDSLPVFDGAQLEAIRAEKTQINIDARRKILTDAATAIQERTTIDARRAARKEEGARIKEEGRLLRERIVPDVDAEYATTKQKWDALTAELQHYAGTIRDGETEIRVVDESIAKLKEREAEIQFKRKHIENIEGEAAEWDWLATACGPDGVQALELDAMGPNIAATANRILHGAYGPRFTLSFPTTRLGGTGKAKRQIEDFQIMVHDAQDDDEAPFEYKSGGEMVWIRRAIYDAFMIERERSTGVSFRTVIMDEADGALDTAHRRQYFKMLEVAHAESGRHHTIIITHSPEAQEMIGQKITVGRE